MSKSVQKKKSKPAKKKSTSGKAIDRSGNNAKEFLALLKTYTSPVELKKYDRYFRMGKGEYGEGDVFIGVRMGQVFELAKAYMEMAPAEIEKLLESPIHEARAAGVSIMDFQARNKKTPESRRKELFNLYIKRHDRINNWDLVDRSAQFVVGGYLKDQPRNILYKLARSKNVWERRTAIVSTSYYIRQRDVTDTFAIAEILVNDSHDLIQKAYGGWIREAGKQQPEILLKFLDKHAATMPRTALRYAIEHLEKEKRAHYLGLKENTSQQDKKPAAKTMKKEKKVAPKKSATVRDEEMVSEYMRKLSHPLKAEMEAVREIIKNTDKGIQERIKWNAPSYHYNGEDMVTFNGWATKNVHLVFHHPEIVNIKSDLLQGDYDKRRMSYFGNMKEVNSSKKELQRVIRELIKKIKKQ